MIRSTELNLPVTDWWQHWIVSGIGIGLALVLARYRYQNLLQWHWIIYGLTNFLLIAVMAIGFSAKGGSAMD